LTEDLQPSPAPAHPLSILLERQRAAHLADPSPSATVRDDRLRRLLRLVTENEQKVVSAIDADFSGRSRHQTLMADVVTVTGTIRHARRHLARWMRPVRVPTAPRYRPAYNRIVRQPLGVVGVVAPWNYPCNLSLCPAVGAIAAGNRVMIKPSELIPRFSDLLGELIAAAFEPEEVAVAIGGADVGKAFVALPFDHLLFTGSTEVGRLVAQAAARNLVPVTLELGGKSPVIVDRSADIAKVATKLVNTKLFNAGQTCIAPDYVIVSSGREAALVAALRAAAGRLYPNGIDGPDATSIINDRHFRRLVGLVDDARAKGARIVELCGTGPAADTARRRLPLTLILGATGDMLAMQEEIFGPVLPIMTCASPEAAIAFVNARPRPLSLYWFGKDKAARDRVLSQTSSGGATINDCMWHFAQEDAPFGGVGASGYGAYHGEHGFKTFSKEKPVFYQSSWSATPLFNPPYGRLFNALMSVMRRL